MLANKFNEAVEVILELSHKVEKLERNAYQNSHKQINNLNRSSFFNFKIFILSIIFFEEISFITRSLFDISSTNNWQNELNIHNNTQRDAIMNMINQYNPIYSELTRIKNVKYIGGYSSFEGSPASKGNLQFDLWGIKPSERYDWNKLKLL